MLFVPGSGVRASRYDFLLKQIRSGLDAHGLASIKLHGFPWGARIVSGGLDPLALAQSVGFEKPASSAEQLNERAWSKLLDDPLYEVRILATLYEKYYSIRNIDNLTSDDSGACFVPDLTEFADNFDCDAQTLRRNDLDLTVGSIVSDEVLVAALSTLWMSRRSRVADIVARALVAGMLTDHRTTNGGAGHFLLYDGGACRSFIARVASTLAADATPTPSDCIVSDAISIANTTVNASPDRITGATGGLGVSVNTLVDTILYLRRGRAVFNEVVTLIRQSPPPVVLLGHSLGSLILADILAEMPDLAVRLLITVGSQVPLFCALDSDVMSGSASNRVPFTPWLNVFDRNDRISFRAEPFFPRIAGVFDRELRSDVCSVDSHNAYWSNDALYRLIEEFWPIEPPADERPNVQR